MLQTYKVHQIDAIADMPDYELYFLHAIIRDVLYASRLEKLVFVVVFPFFINGQLLYHQCSFSSCKG